jgi:hypothetical protein
MRSVRILVVIAATALAFGVLAPSTSAASHKAFHLNKTCASNVLCTVVSDTFKWIPAGTDVTYVLSDPWTGLAYPTIAIRNGSTTGVCDWNQPGPTVLAKCTFGTGTGRLTQFHLAVDVSVTSDSVWHWDGAYWFGGG